VVPEAPEAALRHGVLTLNDVIAQSVTVIAPGLSAGVISYLAATKAGGATPLAFLIALFGTLCIGGVVSEFGRTLPSAGSIYTYTTTGLSRLGGFVVGWIYSITFLILGAAVLAGFAYFASALIQSLTLDEATGAVTTVPWYWFFLGGLVFLAAMSLFDIRISTRSQLVFTALSVAIMLLAALIVIGQGSPPDSVNPDKLIDLGAFWPPAAGVPWTGILFGFAFGILSFTGFETGAVLAEETANPKHNIPRAVIGSVIVAGIFYVITTYATALGFGVREAAAAWPGAAAGLVAVTPYTWLGNLVLFAIAVSCLFCSLGVHTVVSRTFFAMGREHVMPKALGTTHPRHKTPWVAIFADLVLWAVVVFGLLALFSDETEMAAAALPPGTEDPNVGGLAGFAYLATLGTPLVMFSYMLLGLAGVRQGRKVGKGSFVVLGVLSAITGAVAVFGSLYYSFVDGAIFVIRLVPWVVLAIVVLGVAEGLRQRARYPDRWRNMGRIFDAA
jgi:amino acid transporter